MEKFRTFIFGLIMLLYLWYPFSMIQEQEAILEKGTTYRFKLRPVDPVDAFRGRYIRLHYEIFNRKYSNDKDNFQRGQNLYLPLAVDSNGFAYCPKVLSSPPVSGDYISSVCGFISKGRLDIKVPDNMQKYFLNENIAPEAERLYRQLNNRNNPSDSLTAYAEVKVLDGKVLLKQVYFEDVPIEEFIHLRMEKPTSPPFK